MSDEQLSAIGSRLREIIAASGMRQQDVAIRANVGVRTLAWYLAGRDMPVSALIRVADALGMDSGALLRDLAKSAGYTAPPARSVGNREDDDAIARTIDEIAERNVTRKK